jgi:glycosyltransferase involved in cell wall biosynthesis
MEHMHFSLVLPCFNEEENAERAIRDVLSWFDARHIQGELIAVNDGSKDRTGVILQRLASEDPRVKVVTHEKNQGYGAAIRSGVKSAKCPFSFWILRVLQRCPKRLNRHNSSKS